MFFVNAATAQPGPTADTVSGVDICLVTPEVVLNMWNSFSTTETCPFASVVPVKTVAFKASLRSVGRAGRRFLGNQTVKGQPNPGLTTQPFVFKPVALGPTMRFEPAESRLPTGRQGFDWLFDGW
jgi:hypothetical protein